jgi:hypothetical protein
MRAITGVQCHGQDVRRSLRKGLRSPCYARLCELSPAACSSRRPGDT